MSKTKHIYVIYIITTAEKIWDAITVGKLTRQYWWHENVSDWKVGSAWEHRRADDAKTLDLVGKVVESDPPRRLVISWANPGELDTPDKVSRVTFGIKPVGDSMQLTVTHEDLEADSNMEKGINSGWPWVLSSMKSFLESGTPLKDWPKD
jgi:uncharacterized protein YndB with AHSA1/START domain